jgi:hypothetical protein
MRTCAQGHVQSIGLTGFAAYPVDALCARSLIRLLLCHKASNSDLVALRKGRIPGSGVGAVGEWPTSAVTLGRRCGGALTHRSYAIPWNTTKLNGY